MTRIDEPIARAAEDAALLQRFVASREEAAFAALVSRHGPMVLGICRRILRNPSDADDAFQSTFLLLALKAKRIDQPHLLGNWLFGVATRTAIGIRRAVDRRVVQEKRLMRILRPRQADDTKDADLRMMLDEQISRLPEKLRRVIVCCHLEGLTKREAAERLKIPDSTITLRLKQAREMLKQRLVGKGAHLSDATLGTILVAVAVPAALSAGTVKAATLAASGKLAVTGAAAGKAGGLSKGTTNALLATKIKLTAGLLLASTLTVAGTVMVAQPRGSDSPAAPTMLPATTVPAAHPVWAGELSARMREIIFAIQLYSNHHGLPADLKAINFDGKGIEYLGQARVKTGVISTPGYELALIAEAPAPDYDGPIYVGFLDGRVQKLPHSAAQKTIDQSRKIFQAAVASGKIMSDSEDVEGQSEPAGSGERDVASTGVLARVPSVESMPTESSAWRWIMMSVAGVAALTLILFSVRRYRTRRASR